MASTPPDRADTGDDLWQTGPVYSASDRTLARLVARPVREFLRVEAAGSLLLLLAAAVALVWANSPWASSYDSLWHTHLLLDVGPRYLKEPNVVLGATAALGVALLGAGILAV